jgi:hypothetical protein
MISPAGIYSPWSGVLRSALLSFALAIAIFEIPEVRDVKREEGERR